MPTWTAAGLPGHDRPSSLTNDRGYRYEADRPPGAPPVDRAREIPLLRFDADTPDKAKAHFLDLVDRGIEATRQQHEPAGGATAVWRFRGAPPYLNRQARRLGITQVLVDRARHNPEIHRMSVLMGQLCEGYHRLHKPSGAAPTIDPPKLALAKSTLDQIEQEASKLHALAAAAADMLDEAYRAYGLEVPNRAFHVACRWDEPKVLTIPLPEGDGTAQHQHDNKSKSRHREHSSDLKAAP